MLEIKLFGSGELRYNDRLLTGFPNQIPYLLLCYLFLNRRHPHNREVLSAVFWGDHSVASSRKMLRNALWRLRQGLSALGIPVESYFHLEEDSICFHCSLPYRLDVEELETKDAALLEVPGQLLTHVQARALEEAASFYTGDLLEGIYEDWCLYDRERLRLIFQGILCKLMIHSGASGAYEQGIHYGLRLLAMDATWEKIHRHLMWLYWLSSDRGSALAQYKLCRQILREELSTSPTPETQRQYELMLHNRFDPAAWLENESGLSTFSKPPSETPSQTVLRIQNEMNRLKVMIEATRAESDLLGKLIDDALNS
jgi:DNA-binding SARP family transcriptional activator